MTRAAINSSLAPIASSRPHIQPTQDQDHTTSMAQHRHLESEAPPYTPNPQQPIK